MIREEQTKNFGNLFTEKNPKTSNIIVSYGIEYDWILALSVKFEFEFALLAHFFCVG